MVVRRGCCARKGGGVSFQYRWPVIGAPLIWKRYRVSGTVPNLLRPRTMNEKILRRILFDRRPDIATFSGKLESRRFVLDRTGDESLLVDLVGTARNAAELRRLPLPERFIAKANHMSGRNRIHDGSAPLDLDALGRSIEGWCRERSRLQWGYGRVERTAMIERLMQSETGAIPEDYKFFCYDGCVHFIEVDGSRFSGHRRDFFDREWRHLDAVLSYRQHDAPPPPPALLERMIRIAERLATGIDFVRVDLYALGEDVKFGELTCYPGSGMEVFVPAHWDEVMGRPWKLPA